MPNIQDREFNNPKNSLSNLDNKQEDDSTLPILIINDVLKAPIRFNIIFLLYNYDHLGFTSLQKLLNLTAGNLDHHLKKLIEKQWIKDFIIFSPRPLKILKITKYGKVKFDDYIQNLKKIIKSLPERE